VQKATLTTADFGLEPEVALFGSDEWWKAIADGRIPRLEIRGVIANVYMTGHGDWPEFEIDTDGRKTRWTRFGDQSLYRAGREVRVEYVMQRTKKVWLGKHEQENVLRIFVRVDDAERAELSRS
jgi:hypothetical protein